ncbi:unnamed protein product, partial [Polarella glacialis]
MCAMCRGQHVVRLSWVKASLRAKRWVSLRGHLPLPDAQGEELFCEEARQRARERPLLEGWKVFVFPSLPAGERQATLEVVAAAGGTGVFASLPPQQAVPESVLRQLRQLPSLLLVGLQSDVPVARELDSSLPLYAPASSAWYYNVQLIIPSAIDLVATPAGSEPSPVDFESISSTTRTQLLALGFARLPALGLQVWARMTSSQGPVEVDGLLFHVLLKRHSALKTWIWAFKEQLEAERDTDKMLKAWEIKDIGLQATAKIKTSPTPLLTLMRISQNLPAHVVGLSRTSVPEAI